MNIEQKYIQTSVVDPLAHHIMTILSSGILLPAVYVHLRYQSGPACGSQQW